MAFFKSRMRRLEEKSRSELGCPECGLSPDSKGYIRYADKLAPDEPKHCARCGRPLYFIIEIGAAEAGKPMVELRHQGGGGGYR